MLDFPRWKVWSIWLVDPRSASPSRCRACSRKSAGRQLAELGCRSAQINLGLDLAGGSQLLLEADTRDAAKQRLQAMEETVTTELRRGEPRIAIGDISTAGGRLSFMVRDPAQLDAAVERLRTLTQPVGLTGTRDWDVAVVDSTRIVLTPTEARLGQGAEGRDDGRARRRPPPHRPAAAPRKSPSSTRARSGSWSRCPGVEDPEALKALIGQTARLEFKLVDLTADPGPGRRRAARRPAARCCRWPTAPARSPSSAG